MREAEVEQDRALETADEHDVLGREVAVHESCEMQRGEARRQPEAHGAQLVGGQRAAGESLGERRASGEVEHQEGAAVAVPQQRVGAHDAVVA